MSNESNPIIIGDKTILFDATTQGNIHNQYVYGIDPASEKDNFSIVILELHPIILGLYIVGLLIEVILKRGKNQVLLTNMISMVFVQGRLEIL